MINAASMLFGFLVAILIMVIFTDCFSTYSLNKRFNPPGQMNASVNSRHNVSAISVPVQPQLQEVRIAQAPVQVSPEMQAAASVSYFQPNEEPGVNYEDYLLSSGLEPSILESHRRFTDELYLNRTPGASMQSELSHDDSIVPTWGLRRYNKDAIVPINENSREVPSHTNEQIIENTSTLKYGLF